MIYSKYILYILSSCLILASCDIRQPDFRNHSGEISLKLPHGIALEKTSATSIFITDGSGKTMIADKVVGLEMLEKFMVCLLEGDLSRNLAIIDLETGAIIQTDSASLHKLTGKHLNELSFVDPWKLIQSPRFVKRGTEVYEYIGKNRRSCER